MGLGSIITNIIGGIQGASAAGKASNAVQAGYADAVPIVQNATNLANLGITNAAGTAGTGAVNTAAQGAAGMTGAAETGANGVTGAGIRANSALDPYVSNGRQAADSLAAFMAPGGQGTHQFTAADMEQNDPGYQFRLQQGQQALDRSASARGAVMGGGQQKSLADYMQGLASSEYQNAFNRFTTNTQNTYSNLSGMANRGFAAANQAGQNDIGVNQFGAGLNYQGAHDAAGLNQGASEFSGRALMHGADLSGANTIGAGEYAGNAKIGAANAKAQGYIGKANAWNGMLSGIGQGADMFIGGGFGGGGGFNLGNAFKGVAGIPSGGGAGYNPDSVPDPWSLGHG